MMRIGESKFATKLALPTVAEPSSVVVFDKDLDASTSASDSH